MKSRGQCLYIYDISSRQNYETNLARHRFSNLVPREFQFRKKKTRAKPQTQLATEYVFSERFNTGNHKS